MKIARKVENAKQAVINRIVAQKAQQLNAKGTHCSDCGHCVVTVCLAK